MEESCFSLVSALRKHSLFPQANCFKAILFWAAANQR